MTNFVLRPYQEQAVDALRGEYRAGRRAPLYSLPTGGGKTMVFSFIAQAAQRNGNRVLILVHRGELLKQASATLRHWGVAHGLISPRHPMTSHPVQVASVHSAVRRLPRMQTPTLIIIDEAHHAVAGTWRKIVDAFPRALLLGVTATPARLDGRGLGRHCGGYFDTLVTGPSIGSLISDGHLVRPRIFASPRHLNRDGLHITGGDFNGNEAAALVDQAIVGDAVEHYGRLCPGVPAIAFCCTIAHAQMVQQQFAAAGWRARRIDGEMGEEERSSVVHALANGGLDVMVSVDLVSEGFDVPACGAAILLRPTKSLTLYLQQVGRALRTAPGKSCAYILDHAGNVAEHGLPQEDRTWSLDGRGERVAARVTQCPQCFAMLVPGLQQCPECECWLGDIAGGDAAHDGSGPGGRDAPPQVAGDLIELTPELVAQMREQRSREVRTARSREELLRIARERGYNARWVDHVMQARAAGERRAAASAT